MDPTQTKKSSPGPVPAARLLAGLVLLVLAGIVFWAGRPVFRDWKQRRFLKAAWAAYARNDYRNALLAARQPLDFSPSNADACRLMAQIAESQRSPEVIRLRQHVVDLEPA